MREWAEIDAGILEGERDSGHPVDDLKIFTGNFK